MKSLNDFSSQWVFTMWDAVWQSTILACVIFLLLKYFKRAPASVRYWLWMLVPLKLLVMPFFAYYVPVLPSTVWVPVPIEQFDLSMQMNPAPLMNDAGTESFDATPIAIPANELVRETTAVLAPPNEKPSLWTGLLALWIVGGLYMGWRMSRDWRRARQIINASVEAKTGTIADVAHQASKLLELRKPLRIMVSKTCESPFVMGTWKPVVVLPATLVESVERGHLLAVLSHEAAHLRRKDLITGLFLALCEIAYFFHPVLHFVKRKMILEREHACDDWVLVASNAKPSQYARAIIAAAGACNSTNIPMNPATVVAESFADLKHRLLAMASEIPPRAKLSKAVIICLVALTVAFVPAIVFTPRPAASNDTEVEVPVEVPQQAESIPEPTPEPKHSASEFEAKPSREYTTLPEPTHVAQRVSEPASQTKILHFPTNSNLGTLEVLKRRGTDRYRLGRGSDWADVWQPFAEARGEVRIPVGVPLKLRIFDGGLRDLAQLSNFGPDDLHAISFEIKYSQTNEPLVYGEQVLPFVRHLTGLKELEIYGVETFGPGLIHISHMTKLRVLSIGSERFDDKQLELIRDLASLEVLNLYVPVGDEGLRYLAALTSLRELSVKYQRITGRGLAHLGNLPSLEFLEIRGDGIGNRTGGPNNSALRHLEGLKTLRSLTLYSTTNINDSAAVHLKNLSNLEELKFIKQSGTINITDKGMPHIGQMTNLRLLDLGPTLVTDNGLAELRSLENLEDFRLPNSRVTGRSRHTLTDASLAHVAKFRRLKSLFAGRGDFTDEGLSHLSGLTRLESLAINSASESGCTDMGIAYLPQLHRLKTLNLTWGGVTNNGAAHLGKMKSLVSLDLSTRGNRFTVAGVNKFKNLSRLRILNLSNVTRDNSILDIGTLTKLERVSIEIRDPNLRSRYTAVRDADLISIGKLKNLTYLGFYNSPFLSDNGLANLSGLKRLERLSIGGANVTDQGLAHVAGLTSLYQLNITGNFTDRGLRQLDGLNGLRYLSITSGGGVSAQAQQRIRGNLPNLYSFNASTLAGI
jgi:beta-lactamase regulating signal transducer with metallopeptidase domain